HRAHQVGRLLHRGRQPEKNGALVDVDGESPGRIPATFEILPGALTLRY
ncbi:MAG: diacylglycerol kinase family lipid kinase, partial [Mesorhizobium sp.]